VNRIAMYSIMRNPPPAGRSPECIVVLIPEANGVMIVSREDDSTTPAGLTFSTLSEIAGSGKQTPGIMGVCKSYLASPKFISADGGFRRVVWMSSVLKQAMSAEFTAVCEREGDPGFLDKVADERNAGSVDELLTWLHLHDHPALALAPIF
jgi:acetyl-CoA synthase